MAALRMHTVLSWVSISAGGVSLNERLLVLTPNQTSIALVSCNRSFALISTNEREPPVA